MQIKIPKPRACSECGSDPVYHYRDYAALCSDLFLIPLFYFFTEVVAVAVPHSKTRPYLGIYEILVKMRLGIFLDAYDEKTLLLDQVLWDEAKKRGIVMREFRLLGHPSASFVAQYPTGRRISFESFPIPPGSRPGVWWLDIKSIMKKKFHKLGIPIARGGAAFTLYGAEKIFKTLQPPVIIKPYAGSGSRHTTTHINTVEQLRHAFKISQEISPLSVIEEELAGAVYRPTVVGDQLIATIRRDQPCVIGDGIHTVLQLIAQENTHPKRQGPYYQHIKVDDAVMGELTRQNITPENIPERGLRVLLHQKINWSVGGTTTDVTDEVHPDNRELFEHIAKILGAPMVGIDFIIGDISRSWREQERCGVIECNSRPFFDNHHLPFEGKPRNVAGAIWDYAG